MKINLSLFLGLKFTDNPEKVMNILLSKNPDQKIKASSAMDNSMTKSSQIDSYAKTTLDRIGRDPKTFDLKHCNYYANSKPSSKHKGFSII